MQISSTKALLYISLTLAGGKVQYLRPMMKRLSEEELSFYKLVMLERSINKKSEYFGLKILFSIELKRTTTIILPRKADDRYKSAISWPTWLGVEHQNVGSGPEQLLEVFVVADLLYERRNLHCLQRWQQPQLEREKQKQR